MQNTGGHPLRLDTPVALGLRELARKLAQTLPPNVHIHAYIAGGVAAHLYTAQRVSTDVDAEFDQRVRIPADLVVEIKLADGTTRDVYFDTNYNSTFGLMHEDYVRDSIEVPLDTGNVHLRILSPLDLVVSKLDRFSDYDQEDIASLVRHGLVTAAEIEPRAEEAMRGYIGNMSMLRFNVRDALELARRIERERAAACVTGNVMQRIRGAEPRSDDRSSSSEPKKPGRTQE